MPLPPVVPLRNTLIVIKCPLVTRHMLRCDLLNVNSATQNRYVIFFVFQNIEKQANLRLPLHVQKLKVFHLIRPLTPDQGPGVCPWTPLHLLDAHNN